MKGEHVGRMFREPGEYAREALGLEAIRFQDHAVEVEDNGAESVWQDGLAANDGRRALVQAVRGLTEKHDV